jgi:hypothetical protein
MSGDLEAIGREDREHFGSRCLRGGFSFAKNPAERPLSGGVRDMPTPVESCSVECPGGTVTSNGQAVCSILLTVRIAPPTIVGDGAWAGLAGVLGRGGRAVGYSKLYTVAGCGARGPRNYPTQRPNMYRVVRPDGSLSKMVNLTRAREAVRQQTEEWL